MAEAVAAAVLIKMAEAGVELVLDQLLSISWKELEQHLKLGLQLEKDIDELSANFTAIQSLLMDAEKQHRGTEESVRNWLDSLKDVSFQIDDVLDHWNTLVLASKLQYQENEEEERKEKKKVHWFRPFSLPSRQVRLRRNMAKKIRDLNKKLDEIALRRERYGFKASSSVVRDEERPMSVSLVDESNVEGRDEQKKALIGKLLSESTGPNCLDVIPIVGIGGIGKTTLAQLVYNNETVMNHFEKRIWVCVSDPFDSIRIAKVILESLTGKTPDSNELEFLLQAIREPISDRRFLLVLDDVWTDEEAKWEQLTQPLKYGAPGSKILVTTRKETVARMMGLDSNRVIFMEILPEEFCWSIFSKRAFLNRSEDAKKRLESIGRKIALKSKGLPLFAKALGGLMRSKNSMVEWEEVLQSELWELQGETKISVPYLLSYDDLSPQEKRCFLFCASFPKDHDFDVEDLIQMWMSQGYLSGGRNLETTGLVCFNNLAMRSFFHDFRKDYNENVVGCKMHDIVHDFLQFLSKDEFLVVNYNAMRDVHKIENARHVTVLMDNEIDLEWLNKGKMRSLIFVNSLDYRIAKFIARFNRELLAQRSCASLNVEFFPKVDAIPEKLMCLRMLDLSFIDIAQLPINMNKMMHLRYLNLSSNTSLEACHESVCQLVNLQTLRLSGCRQLRRLPDGIGKLINLRHLYIDGCSSLEGLPKEIERLSCMQTLNMYVVPTKEYTKDREPLSCRDLSKLKLTQRFLCLSGCKRIQNPSEAESAELKKREFLEQLSLNFRDTSVDGRDDVEEERRILEALQPHPNLTVLSVSSFSGDVFPNWVTGLICLKSIELSNLFNCETLPPLGKLPSLESLQIRGMRRLKKIGIEFLGVVGETHHLFISFPKLKTLLISGMESWEEWECKEDCYGRTIMPQLASLNISGCKSLKALPDFLRRSPLQRLEIYESDIVKGRCEKDVGEDWHKISHIPNITIE